jgi:CHAT domain
MATRSYENFDVRIEGINGAYRARVWAASGEGASEFDLAVAKETLDGFLFKVAQARRRTRRGAGSSIEEAKRFGELLFRSVFTGDALECLQRCLTRSSEEELGTRIRLRLVDVPELSNLPWEFLYNPLRRQFFSLSIHTPIIRYLEFADGIRPLRVKPPLRVLAVISNPSDYPRLDVEREWNSLQDALSGLIGKNLVILERLDRARFSALDRYIQRNPVHILHFIGHGDFDEGSSELVFEDEFSRGRSISADGLPPSSVTIALCALSS